MPRYTVQAPDGRRVTVEGDSPPTDADLDGIFASLPAKATAAGPRPYASLSPAERTARDEQMRHPDAAQQQRERELNMAVRMTEPEAAGRAVGLASMIPLAGGMAMAPVATLKGLAGGMLGAAGGSEAGRWVGRNLPIVGGETAANVLGTVGGLVGGGFGAVTAPKVEGGRLLKLATGGKGGLLADILGGTEAQTAVASREAAAAETAALRNEYLKTRTEAVRQRMADSMRRTAIATAKEARLAKKAGITVPELRTGVVEAAAPAAETAAAAPTVLPAGERAMPTNLGGKGRPGPPPTAPDDVEAALQQTLDKINAAKARAAAPTSGRAAAPPSEPPGPLQPQRIQVGAQRVGREVGLTKEQVRQQAGPVLDEARGEASPILPEKALQSIIDKMKSLPRTGGEREAYVARATSGKSKWQIENIRRTLEHLGLLPVIAAPAAGLTLGQIIQGQE